MKSNYQPKSVKDLIGILEGCVVMIGQIKDTCRALDIAITGGEKVSECVTYIDNAIGCAKLFFEKEE